MQIIDALIPLVVLIAMGYVLKRYRFLTMEFWQGAERLNYWILFPVLLFSSLATVHFNVGQVLPALAVVFTVTLLMSVVLWVLKAVYGTPVAKFGVYLQSHIRFNTYIGLTSMALIFGAEGMQVFAMIIAFVIPLVNVLSVLGFSQGQGLSYKNIAWSIAKNPLILACLVGIIFNFSGMHLPESISQSLKLVAGMSLPLGLLCVGAALQFNTLKYAGRALILNTFGRLILVPILAYTGCRLMGLATFETMIVVVFFSLPTASAAYVLTKYFQGDSQLMAAIISLQTLCFGLTFPLWMWFLQT